MLFVIFDLVNVLVSDLVCCKCVCFVIRLWFCAVWNLVRRRWFCENDWCCWSSLMLCMCLMLLVVTDVVNVFSVVNEVWCCECV